MPLISSIDHGSLGTTHLWWIKEDEDYFIKELVTAGLDLKVMDGWHPKRQQEWLSGRNLIHTYINHPIIAMDISPQGKPYFKDDNLHFSLSHSGNLVVLTKSQSTVGIDVQLNNPKMGRLAHKFVNETDLNALPSNWPLIQKQHLIWCAKEAMFKAYGEGEVDFKKHMSIAPSGSANIKNQYKGQLQKEKVDLEFIIRYRQLGSSHLVHAWQV